MTGLQHLSSGIRHFATHCLHHFFVALTVASIVVVAEHYGFLNWLDSLSLRTVGALIAAGDNTQKSASMQGGKTPHVLLIANEYYESAFFQESPLNKGKLAGLIRRVAAAKPAVIAIDLDLSPGPVGARSNTGQEELDRAIIAAVKHARIPVVVTTPFPVATEFLLLRKHAWLDALCRQGVAVALPHLVTSQGIALRYAQRQPSLGLIAYDLFVGQPARGDLCASIAEEPEKTLRPRLRFAS